MIFTTISFCIHLYKFILLILFSVCKIEMNEELTKAAQQNEAMKALYVSGRSRTQPEEPASFVIGVQHTNILLNDALAWLITTLGIPATRPPMAGCYIASCVYGSYDCPQVWTLRRFRDNTLAATWYGRLFIKIYYAVSPTLVKLFGGARWFREFWKRHLDKAVEKLKSKGVESTRYIDKNW